MNGIVTRYTRFVGSVLTFVLRVPFVLFDLVLTGFYCCILVAVLKSLAEELWSRPGSLPFVGALLVVEVVLLLFLSVWQYACACIDGGASAPESDAAVPTRRPWWARAATLPLDLFWLVWVGFVCAGEGVLVCALAGTVGAILWVPAALLDAAVGAPVARFGLVALAVPVALHLVVELLRRAHAKWNECPW